MTEEDSIILIASLAFCLLLMAWLWWTRERNFQNVSSKTNRIRFLIHLFFLIVPSIMIILGIRELIEQDGTWHQTIVRDESQFELVELVRPFFTVLVLLSPLIAFIFALTRLNYYVISSKLPYVIMLISWFALPLLYALEASPFFDSINLMQGIGDLALLGVWYQVVRCFLGLKKPVKS